MLRYRGGGYGGIAQLARAFGSYPKCHWFKSSCRYQIKNGFIRFHIDKRPGGQAVKTPPFHGGNTGSSPVRVTTFFQPFIWRHSSAGRASASHAEGHRFEFCCLHHIVTGPNRKVRACSFSARFGGTPPPTGQAADSSSVVSTTL